MLSPWTIAAWAVLTVLVGVGVAVWLLLAYTGGNSDANQVQLDAIRTAGTIVVGTGGAAALLLAARRQRTAEIALKQKDRDQADVARAHAHQVEVAEQTRQHHERVAASTEADAEARRITDLYTKAVEQIGSEKAPVRLGGLYALERLAQDHVEQRQTIVNVLCAYLRMPYTLPGDPPGDDADDKLITAHRERVQEREVRLAAQRILAHHLRPGGNPDNPAPTFWANIDLDLIGATLIDLDFNRCTMRDALFGEATFAGVTGFIRTTFTRAAGFGWATFTGSAGFNGATFNSAFFGCATFLIGTADFSGATFLSSNTVQFGGARFTGSVDFSGVTFTGGVDFSGVTLPSTRYDGSDTWPWTSFTGAQFERNVPREVARFVASPEDAEGNTPTKQ